MKYHYYTSMNRLESIGLFNKVGHFSQSRNMLTYTGTSVG